MFDLMHTPDLLGWEKRSDIAIVQIELSESKRLSDTQVDLCVVEMRFIFCG